MGRVLFGVLGILLTGCFGTQSPSSSLRLRFQNLLGLELSVGGCSVLNNGGVDRMCEYDRSHSADLVFQIGPAFNRLIDLSTPLTAEVLEKRRALIWKEWQKEKVAFYAVSPWDLAPSLDIFRKGAKASQIPLVSSDLKTPDKKNWLFEPYFVTTVGKTQLVFLAFSELSADSKPAGWAVETPALAFAQVKEKLPASTDVYHIAGALKKSTREQIAKLADKPVLFVGGELLEQNTIHIVPEASGSHYVKAPDMSRGFGLLYLDSKTSSKNAVQIGPRSYRFEAHLLPEVEITHAECRGLNSEDSEGCSLDTLAKTPEPCD